MAEHLHDLSFVPYPIPEKWLKKTNIYMPPVDERIVTLGEHYDSEEGVTIERSFVIRTPCLLWTGWNSGKGPNDGYGKAKENGKTVYLHRRSYELANNCDLDTLDIVDHLCRHHPCWNPDHLERVTPAENIARGLGVSYWFKRRYDD